jgi:hypothetical protein
MKQKYSINVQRSKGKVVESWTLAEAQKNIYNFAELTDSQKQSLVQTLDARFSLPVYRDHLARQRSALRNAESQRTILDGAKQAFPHLIQTTELEPALSDLDGYAVVLTAGGDGERLRLSLRASGASEDSLRDFTKATFQLPGFPAGYGSLGVNCAVIADLCRKSGIKIPVVITTGPSSSVTARVIPETLKKFNGFGLTSVRTVAQGERLHLTLDGKIVAVCDGDTARPATNPDETGGPFVQLTNKGSGIEPSVVDWLRTLSVTKIIALQATGLYDPSTILAMATAGKRHDCLGVGILRSQFEANDPFGTFVIIDRDGKESLTIVEQGIRNDATRACADASGRYRLPYNTGLYVFDVGLISDNTLPDYATPPKEILPSIPQSPKIGFAITDIMPCAKNGAVLAIAPDSYENIKNVGDLQKMAALARRYGILDLCK